MLYGDGIHDDYQAIQELLDSGECEIRLPMPKVKYCISKTLKIHSNQAFILPRYARISLMPDSNCAMMENADFSKWENNIRIEGGIWDMNHNEQEPNPGHFHDKHGKTYHDYNVEIGWDAKTASVLSPNYIGFCMKFCRVRNFEMVNLTFENPVTYGVQISFAEYFTFQNIRFEYNEGSPKLWNMDGIHVEGNCKHGYINNLQGACHDDLVALTADDGGPYGPIEDIVIDGIFAEGSHSAVRLLSHGQPVRNIRITNVFGSYYVYAIGITKYHGGPEERGYIENISIDNLYIRGAAPTKDVNKRFPLIWVQKGLDINRLDVHNVYRDEKERDMPLLRIDEGSTVKNLSLDKIYQKNYLETPVPFVEINGEVNGFQKGILENE